MLEKDDTGKILAYMDFSSNKSTIILIVENTLLPFDSILCGQKFYQQDLGGNEIKFERRYQLLLRHHSATEF